MAGEENRGKRAVEEVPKENMPVNDSLRPIPRASEPSDAVSSTPASSLDSSDSYNGDDARCFLREWRAA